MYDLQPSALAYLVQESANECDPCEAAIMTACNSTRMKAFECAQCSGVHQQELKAAECTNDQIAKWCAGLPINPSQCANVMYVWNETRALVASYPANCTVPSPTMFHYPSKYEVLIMTPTPNFVDKPGSFTLGPSLLPFPGAGFYVGGVLLPCVCND